MLRKLAVSHWTAVAIGIVLVVVHGIWFLRSDHQGDVISGFGVSLAVLGIFVTAQPFIRQGIENTARLQAGFAPLSIDEQEWEDAARRAAIRFVLKERVFGVVLIAIGTLFNGYANALARVLSLKV